MAAARYRRHAVGDRSGGDWRHAAIVRIGARLAVAAFVCLALGRVLRALVVHHVFRPLFGSAVYLLPVLSAGAMPQFVFKLSLLLPLLAGMAWVNWSIDPAILMLEHQDDPTRHPYENAIARDLLAGYPHRLKAPHLEIVVDELVFRARPQIDTLVFGTSIAKPIHAGLFGGPNFFNASVTGGRIEEMIMAYQLALDCGLKPRHVLIEVDSRSLSPRDGVPDSKLLERGLRRLNLPFEIQRDSILRRVWRAFVPGEDGSGAATMRGSFYPYDELLSPRYFQFTMAFLARRWLARGDKP